MMQLHGWGMVRSSGAMSFSQAGNGGNGGQGNDGLYRAATERRGVGFEGKAQGDDRHMGRRAMVEGQWTTDQNGCRQAVDAGRWL